MCQLFHFLADTSAFGGSADVIANSREVLVACNRIYFFPFDFTEMELGEELLCNIALNSLQWRKLLKRYDLGRQHLLCDCSGTQNLRQESGSVARCGVRRDSLMRPALQDPKAISTVSGHRGPPVTAHQVGRSSHFR